MDGIQSELEKNSRYCFVWLILESWIRMSKDIWERKRYVRWGHLQLIQIYWIVLHLKGLPLHYGAETKYSLITVCSMCYRKSSRTLIINLIMNQFSLTIMAIYNIQKYFLNFDPAWTLHRSPNSKQFSMFKKKGLRHFMFRYRVTSIDRNQGGRTESLVKWKIDLNSNNNHNNKISNVQ